MNIFQNLHQWMVYPSVRQQSKLNVTIRTTHTRWAKLHPEWAIAFFDEHFLLHRAVNLLSDFASGAKVADATLLAGLWASQFPFSTTQRQRRVTELLPAAKDFLELFDATLCAQERQKADRFRRLLPQWIV